MRGQSRDELERMAKISKEKLIISLLKSKQSIGELFNNNLDDDKISDIRRILNRLRGILPKRYRKEIKTMKIFQKQKKKKMMNILEN